MTIQDIMESRARWAKLDPEDPLYDSRLVSYPNASATWVHPAHAVDSDVLLPHIFGPDYSPMQMMQMGIFGDAYWGDDLGQQRKALLPQNYPFTRSGMDYTDTRGKQCPKINHNRRPASETREWWLNKQIISNLDPLGWFEWYCWYWLGRRIPAYDTWQITRWVGFKQRHLPAYHATGYPGSAQALLHWGIRADA